MSGELLQIGQTVKTVSSSQPCRVEAFIGEGGQGEVYKVTVGGKPFALKWYFPRNATREQWEGLANLIASGPPQKSTHFLWPIELVVNEQEGRYGYLMKLREPRFKGLYDLMCGKIDPTFRVLTTIGLGLTEGFYQLHAAGLCYRDISFGNAFFDPKTGEVQICDNDNVAANNSKGGGVLGTPDFMAPEIVRGEAAPNLQTDLHSLAVLLFYLFHIQHPFYGKKLLKIPILDLPSREILCGKEPLFIFDPQDKSNEAVNDFEAGANALKYWPIYPKYFRDLFTKSFTEGIRDRVHGRVREGIWRQTLSRLRDSIFYCMHCAAGNFYDIDAQKAGAKPTCCRCKKETSLPYRIRIGRSIVMLNYDSKLYPHHLNDAKQFDFSAPMAEMVQNPNNPKQWGLRNLSDQRWVLTRPDNTITEVERGKSVTVVTGVKINFGHSSGEIRY